MSNTDTLPCQIYLITPPTIPDMDVFLHALEAAITAAPVACLQIRLKTTDEHDRIVTDSSAIIQAASAITPLCHQHGVDVIINDDPSLVEPCGADGVHIGQDDMDYFAAREMLGGDAIIGVTCHNSRELAFSAAHAGADYVAFGAFFETPTKDPKARAELEILQWWQEAVEIPCVAIGGITVNNAASVIEAGADFIAVSSGVWDHPEGPAAAVLALSSLCQSYV